MIVSTWAKLLWALAILCQSWAQSHNQEDTTSSSSVKRGSEERKEKGCVIKFCFFPLNDKILDKLWRDCKKPLSVPGNQIKVRALKWCLLPHPGPGPGRQVVSYQLFVVTTEWVMYRLLDDYRI